MTQTRYTAELPVADLVHASNIRQASSPQKDDELRASILSQKKILQNLIAAPRKSDGKIAVFAGGRRLNQAQGLVADGELEAGFTATVLVCPDIDPDSPDAIEMALAENIIRESMDYMDECDAMLMLSAAGRENEDIAIAFGYRSRTIQERLLIANLVPEAQDLVRNKERNLEWARALTIADKSMQKKICDDVAANGNAWKTGDDIRTYLTKATIPCENAIFDIEDYKGVIVSDFFEGDHFADVDMFWELQNEAVQARLADMEVEGFGEGVEVLYEPFQDWRYEETDDKTEAKAFIEVMPSGKVREFRNKKALQASEITEDASLNASDAHGGDALDADIASFEVRATPRIREYAAAHRSAMLQAHLAGDFRASLEYTVLAFLGQRTATFGVNPFQIPGKDNIKVGEAFRARVDILAGINQMTNYSVDETDIANREAMQVAIVRQMDDENLQKLFALLVSQRAGQAATGAVDSNEASMANIFGKNINVRDYWTPSEEFFGMMSSEDLRRLATDLLPGLEATRFASSKRKNLVRALADAFQQAGDGALSQSLAERYNGWVPGVMSFPAHIVTNAELEAEMDTSAEDLEASIFDLSDDDFDA